MARKRITGVGVGSPLASASLSWEYVDAEDDPSRRATKGCLVLPGGQLPKVSQVTDPIMMGVHPSSPIRDSIHGPAGESLLERVPAYVTRDVDDELRNRVSVSGFVIVVGDSSAGKSRGAYEAIARLRDHVLIVPQNRDALAAALKQAAATRRCVLWLDDLENYLGADGLTRSGIAPLLMDERSHRVIMATLRAAEEAVLTYEAPGQEGGWRPRKDAREVLELGHRIRLPRMYSSPERERARAQAWDPRIGDALARADAYGVGEYLAAGPELLRDWENAWSPNTDARAPSHPRGAALIAAAVDIRRGGYTSPLPRTLLDEVHGHYLQERGGSRLRPEPLAEAWAWTTKARRATTALLESVDDQHVQVFDYLLDTVQRGSSPDDHVPDSVLAATLAVSAASDAVSIASMAYDHGRYQLAETAWLTAYQTRAEDLGPEHPETLAARASHANMLRDLGRAAEAGSEHGAIAEIAARVYGPEHRQVLESRNGRAFALIRQGHFHEAEEELRAVQQISSRVLGPGHDVTMTSRHLHAMALHHLGRLDESETENRSVLAAWTQELGSEHPITLLSQGNLAAVLHAAGQLEEAESEARAVLDIRTRVFGPTHPRTLSTRALHANMLRDLGRAAEAGSEHGAIAEIAARVYGPEHRQVLESRNGRAFALIRQGHFHEAEEELRAVQQISSRVLGPGHDVTMTSRHLHAMALHHLGRLDESETENRSVLAACTRRFGPEHAITLLSQGNLAAVLHAAGQLEEAESEARAVLDIRTRVLGLTHPDTMHIRSLLTLIEHDLKLRNGSKSPGEASQSTIGDTRGSKEPRKY